MECPRRLVRELEELRALALPYWTSLEVDEVDLRVWRGLLLPRRPPYNKGAFLIELRFPNEYPFKPPKLDLLTKIYHPNVDEDGKMCLPIITSEHWKPTTRVLQVLEALVTLIERPDPDRPYRPEVAKEFLNDHRNFKKNAEEFTVKNALKRPI